ncbi:MAG: SUMF1/EgtB/PvdO family nonheme iron enzyme [Lentisphaerae bacterium]|nr:SUMF1/EgtB/PvdO family nonheme iron enzyme [Lentisphaerota bacterium]
MSAIAIRAAEPAVPAQSPERRASPAGMALIPAGSFEMGDNFALAWGAVPVHSVPVSAFWMDATETSNEALRRVCQWAWEQGRIEVKPTAVLNREGLPRPLFGVNIPAGALTFSNGVFGVVRGKEVMPCVSVTWYGALAFAYFRTEMENEKGGHLRQAISLTDWTVRLTDDGYRLPTEAEWEKAARGGLMGQHFPWVGSDPDYPSQIDGTMANYLNSGDPRDNDETPCGYYNGVSIPGIKNMTNGYGLYDMAGNVWEWCADWFDADAYKAFPPRAWPPDPRGPERSPWDARVIRGGSFFYTPEHLRCAYRSYLLPEESNHLTGFRCVRSVEKREGIPSALRIEPSSPPIASAKPATQQELVEADWLRQDQLEGPDAEFERGADKARSLLLATLDLLSQEGGVSGDDKRQSRMKLLSSKMEQSTRAASEKDWRQVYLEIRWARRLLLLSDPRLAFDRLLIVKRGPPRFISNMCDQYLGRFSVAGDGLVVLDRWRETPEPRVLFPGQGGRGAVLNPDLSFDGRRALFAFCDHAVTNSEDRRYFIYEAELDGSGARQVTGKPGSDPLEGHAGRQTAAIEDVDPCYLPDGGFCFLSTRCQSFGRCHGGRYAPAFVLYRANADGGGIRRLSFGEMNEWNPSVLTDGRIIFTRWEHVNRHDALFQGLWTCRPDGSGVAHYYGNYSPNPSMTAEAKTIPGSTKIVATAMAHHSTTTGSLILIDREKGEDGLAPLTRLTPETVFPESEGWPVGHYANPWPISEGLCLAAYSPDRLPATWETARRNAYGIYLVDSAGGRELIHRDPDSSCFSPIPVQPRVKPPVIPSVLAAARTDALCLIQDVTRSTHPIPTGTVKAIRVVRLYEQPEARSAPRSWVGNELVKGVLGTAPVQPDGSAAFRVPAGVPMLFQLLDANGMSVFGMRSQVYFQPGETVSCEGCHEPRNAAPSATTAQPKAFSAVSVIASGAPSGFSFARAVQPVLDRYCIACHGLSRKDGELNLLGTPTERFNTAYESLVTRPGMVALARRNEETIGSRPGDYGAVADRLAALLLAGHGAKLDAPGFLRIVEWLDLNAPYYGDYSLSRTERIRPAASKVAALRDHIRSRMPTPYSTWADDPLDALVNLADPAQSRILMAPLADTAGGWGQGATILWRDKSDPGYQALFRQIANLVSAGRE